MFADIRVNRTNHGASSVGDFLIDERSKKRAIELRVDGHIRREWVYDLIRVRWGGGGFSVFFPNSTAWTSNRLPVVITHTLFYFLCRAFFRLSSRYFSICLYWRLSFIYNNQLLHDYGILQCSLWLTILRTTLFLWSCFYCTICN